MSPRSWFALLGASLFTWVPSSARSQEPPPTFVYQTPPEKFADETVWKANVQAGFLYVSGNAETIGGSFAGTVSYRHKFDQLELTLRTAYAYSGTSSVTGGPIDGHVTSAENWLGRLRYDRFFDERNSVYAAYQMNGDRLAGIAYRIEPQVGFAHRFIADKQQTLRGEAGFDYMYERYLAGSVPIDNQFYSIRLYGFYENKFNALASFSEGVELLEALNTPEHFLLNSVTSLTSTITSSWALKVSYILHLNFDPPNRPPPNVGTFGVYDGTLEVVLALTIG
jgi:putative salt-induced outer membrane protein YdiY